MIHHPIVQPYMSPEAATIGTIILRDYLYSHRYSHMTDAERWTRDHGFSIPTRYRKRAGQSLAEVLDAEPTAVGKNAHPQGRISASNLSSPRNGSQAGSIRSSAAVRSTGIDSRCARWSIAASVSPTMASIRAS
jgi:hypothetical protein